MTAKELTAFCRKHSQKLLIAGLILGLLLILIPTLLPDGKSQPVGPDLDLKQETESYRTELTGELSEMLSEIKGVGQVKLFITLENSIEYEYLKEESENTDLHSDDKSRDYSETYLFVEDAAGNRKVLAVKRILPKVRGAVVVCEGGEDILVKQQVIELLRAALGVSAANISVSPLA